MHLDEVECVIGELIGYLVPLHGWSAGTVARPENGEEGEKCAMRRRDDGREENGEWKEGKAQKEKALH